MTSARAATSSTRTSHTEMMQVGTVSLLKPCWQKIIGQILATLVIALFVGVGLGDTTALAAPAQIIELDELDADDSSREQYQATIDRIRTAAAGPLEPGTAGTGVRILDSQSPDILVLPVTFRERGGQRRTVRLFFQRNNLYFIGYWADNRGERNPGIYMFSDGNTPIPAVNYVGPGGRNPTSFNTLESNRYPADPTARTKLLMTRNGLHEAVERLYGNTDADRTARRLTDPILQIAGLFAEAARNYDIERAVAANWVSYDNFRLPAELVEQENKWNKIARDFLLNQACSAITWLALALPLVVDTVVTGKGKAKGKNKPKRASGFPEDNETLLRPLNEDKGKEEERSAYGDGIDPCATAVEIRAVAKREIRISTQLTKYQTLNRCMYDGGGASGAKVWATTCPYRGYSSWNDYGTRWLYMSDGHILSLSNSQCLNASMGKVTTLPCAPIKTQIWELRPDRGISSAAGSTFGKCLRANESYDGTYLSNAYWNLKLGGCSGGQAMWWTDTVQLRVDNKYRYSSYQSDCVYGRLWDYSIPATAYGSCRLDGYEAGHELYNDKDYSHFWFWKGDGSGAGQLTDDLWDGPGLGHGKGCLRGYGGDSSIAPEACADASRQRWVLRKDHYVEYKDLPGKCMRITAKDYKWWSDSARYIYRPMLGDCPANKNAENFVRWELPEDIPQKFMGAGAGEL
ncbi:ribosome-inactivating family protein [Streptomyces lavendulocolor]|uniref:ribosome-inactivating family protein n=1 Tax=Streptomyces lavendulocolor TaxID=67316 RepID=UPI0033DFB4B5